MIRHPSLFRFSTSCLSTHPTLPSRCRFFASSIPPIPVPTTFTGVTIQPVEKGIKKLSLSSSPVNSLTTNLMVEIEGALRLLEDDGETQGVLLCSSVPNIFSAGLDIKTMYQPEEEKAKRFWTALHQLFYRLYGTPLTTVAVIEGHAPAGGCFLSMCCDGRVMNRGKGRIGLNEAQLGISAPWWFAMLFKDIITPRLAERHLQLGTLFTPEEALIVGLVDELSDEAFPAGLKMLKNFTSVPDQARRLCKQQLRKSTVQVVQGARDADVKNFWHLVNTPMVQESLKNYLASLSSPQRKKE
eukprot:TRINITY_DN822_c0_g1_i2.p1 TRINITY_DN822_c0_g1~~TRINITY_DN822_c0_g1_i2.p1  ORF type:complete len:299 (-),score=80.83 TRINITY_DN822_c0_g1_i2:137-1033(-)